MRCDEKKVKTILFKRTFDDLLLYFCSAKEIKPGSSVRKVVKKVVRRSGGGVSGKDSLARHSATNSAISHSHNKVSINSHGHGHGPAAARPASLPLSSSHGERHHERHHERQRSSGGAVAPSNASRHSSPAVSPGASTTLSSAKSQSGGERRSGAAIGTGGSSNGSASSRHSSPAPQSSGRSQTGVSERNSNSNRSSPSQSPHQSHTTTTTSSSSMSSSSSSSSSSKPLQNITMTSKSTSNPAIMNTPLRLVFTFIHSFCLSLSPMSWLRAWSSASDVFTIWGPVLLGLLGLLHLQLQDA